MSSKINDNICEECEPSSLICQCGKVYKYLGSLNKHKKLCQFNEINRENCLNYKELYEQSLIRTKNLEKLIIQIALQLKQRGINIEFIS